MKYFSSCLYSQVSASIFIGLKLLYRSKVTQNPNYTPSVTHMSITFQVASGYQQDSFFFFPDVYRSSWTVYFSNSVNQSRDQNRLTVATSYQEHKKSLPLQFGLFSSKTEMQFSQTHTEAPLYCLTDGGKYLGAITLPF